MGALEVFLAPDGTIRTIYSDDLMPAIAALGPAEVTRASHVEPAAGGGWTADMGPSGGPVLGPFATRQEALDREVAWLRENVFGVTEHLPGVPL